MADESAILFQVISVGMLPLVQVALASAASLSSKDDLGNMPLCAPASALHKDIVEHLLKAGAEIASPGCCELTTLHLAARDGHVEIVRLWLDRGAATTERVLNAC